MSYTLRGRIETRLVGALPVLVLALVLHRWMGLLSDRVYRGVLGVSSLILAVYGATLLGQGLAGAASERGGGRP